MFNRNFDNILLAIITFFVGAGILVIVIGLVFEPSNEENGIHTDSYASYRIVCMNGVEYYQGAKKLAPVVDAETLTFKRCTVGE